MGIPIHSVHLHIETTAITAYDAFWSDDTWEQVEAVVLDAIAPHVYVTIDGVTHDLLEWRDLAEAEAERRDSS